MAVSHRGAISFGMVHIPVGLYTATSDNAISFNQLHKACGQRIRYKKLCSHCDTEVKSEDIIKGYEFEKDKYITLSEDEIESIKTEKDKTMEILHFADLSDIDTIYYEKSYHAVPEAGGDKAFELLRTAMEQGHKVAIARTVLGTKETLLTILPTQSGMVVETMFYADEIKAVPKLYHQQVVSDQELGMANMLLESMTKPFDATLYHDEYQNRLRQAIEQKINNGHVTAAPLEAPNNVINLMEALQASLQQQKETGDRELAGVR